jgi:type IV pilus assembly protein PilM
MLTLYAKNPFGLDISDHSITALSLRKKKAKIILDAYNRLTIPSGIVENGVILDIDKLVPYLKKVSSKSLAKSFGTNQCLITLPQSQCYTHLATLSAGLTLPQLKTSLAEKIMEIIPLPIDDLAYSYVRVGKAGDNNKEKFFIIAVPRAILDSYLEVLHKADLQALAIDVGCLNQARTLLRDYDFKETPDLPANNQAVMIIDSGYQTTNLSFFTVEGIQFTSQSKIAGHQVVELLAAELALNLAQAEEEKRTKGVAKIARNPKFREIIGQLANEIQESIDYFQKVFGSVVKEIILTGGNSLIAGLPEYLSMVLKITVRLGDPFLGIEQSKKKLIDREAVLYTNVVGLALRGFYWKEQAEESSINFLDTM